MTRKDGFFRFYIGFVLVFAALIIVGLGILYSFLKSIPALSIGLILIRVCATEKYSAKDL